MAGHPTALVLLQYLRDGTQLLEQRQAVLDLARVGRVEPVQLLDVVDAEAGQLQQDAGQVGAADLRLGELRAGVVVGLAVQPDRDAGGQAAGAAGALGGAGLADRLDRETLHLRPQRVPADPGQAGVHDVADPGHRQRGLGDVGADHHPGAGVRGEDAVLVGRGQPGVQRQHLQAQDRAGQLPGQRVAGFADLALAGAEHQHVTVALGEQLGDGVHDGLRLVPVVPGGGLVPGVGPVADVDGVRAP